MTQVLPRSVRLVAACLSAAFLVSSMAASSARAQVEGRESPQFGAPPTTTPPLPNDRTVPPPLPEPGAAPMPMPGEQPAPQSAPPATLEQQQHSVTLTPSEEQITLGNELMAQNKHELALQHYEEAAKLAAEPEDQANAFFALGNALRTLDRLDDAIDAYSASIAAKSDDGEVYLRRGIAWFHKGEYSIAWRDFDDASTIYYGAPEPYADLWKGLAKAQQGLWLEAIEGYTAAVLAEPRFSLAYSNRGLAYLHLNEPRKAEADFEQAIRNEPRNPVHYFRRGLAETQMGHTADAIRSFGEAVRMDPSYSEAAKHLERLQGRASR